MNRQLKIVVVGEVDSGKSTLIGRLLFDTGLIAKDVKEGLKKTCEDLGKNFEFAYLLDSFREEREEDFTLDTTQALLKTENGDFLLVDVPGHREFLKNMLTGASYADAAILAVDVNSPLGEQAKRHLYVLKFLGINEVGIAVNKMDSVSYSKEDFYQKKEALMEFCKDIGMGLSFAMPVSAKEGDNLIKESSRMSWYEGPCLIEALNIFTVKSSIFGFRFPIQDIYDIKDKKVAIGTVISGRADRKDLVKVSSIGRELKIKKVLAFNEVKSRAETGESMVIVFDNNDGLKRGDVVYKNIPPRITNEFQARIFCLSELKKQERLSFKCVTQEVYARICEITESINTGTFEIRGNIETLEEADAADVAIATEAPVAIEKFQDLNYMGRFILQRNGQPCAIGIVC